MKSDFNDFAVDGGFPASPSTGLRRHRLPFGVMPLEPRLMYDGAAATTAAHAAADAAAKALIPAVAAPVEVQAADASKDGGKKEVTFVDTSLNNWRQLVGDIQTSKPGMAIELIDGGKDGLAQMAVWAESNGGYDAIHVLSHGSEGVIELGTGIITDAGLSNATIQAELAEIGHALNAGGDLLIYGCDVAEGTDGQQLIADLAAATGANVAASADATGATDLGGNWTLESKTGAIDFAALDLMSYEGLLSSGTVTFSNGDNSTYNLANVSSFTETIGGVTFTFSVDNDSYFHVENNGWSTYGLYALDGGTNGSDVKVTITIQSGYTFDLSGFSFEAYSSSNPITVSFTSSGVSYTDTYTTSTDGALVTETSFTNPVHNVSSLSLSANDYAIFQNLVFTNIRPPSTVAQITGTDTVTTIADNTTTTPFSGLTYVDTNGPSYQLAITYTAADGTLSGTGLSGSAGNYTLTGTSAADMTTKLEALIFTPTVNQVAVGNTVQTTFTLSPTDVTGEGAGPTDDGTVITVTSANDAPTLSSTSQTLTSEHQTDSTAPTTASQGTAVSSLVSLSGNVSDPDVGAVTGIAVTSLDTSHGSWYYYNGSTWTLVTSVSTTNALLLSPTDRLYFKDDGTYTGTLSNAATFSAWDQTTGTHGTYVDVSTRGGSTAFSSATANGSLTVIDNVAPTVASDVRVGSTPTNASSEQFTVTFSESVSGVDASDFTVTTTGTVNSTGITVTPVSGTVYTVAVTGVSGAGTLRLDLNASGTGITDTASNAISGGYTSGQVYTVDAVAPTVSSDVRVGSTPTNASSEQFTVTFSKSVSGVDASDFTVTTTGTVNSTGITVTPVSGTVYTVAVTGISGTGTLRLDLNASGTGITDTIGNAISGGYTSGQVYTVDTSAPVVSSVSAPAVTSTGGTSYSFDVVYSDTGTGIDSGTIDLTNVTVTKPGGGTLTVTSVTWNAGTNTATYTVSPPSSSWQTSDVGTYTIAMVAGQVKDLVGNVVAANATEATFVVGFGPVVSAGHSSSFSEGGTAGAIDSSLALSDPNSSTISGATVTISSGFLSGDALGFVAQNGIAGSYNASTGVMTLSGTASLANYQAALRSVTFGTASDNPTNYGAATSRTITWQIDDGQASNNTGSGTTTVSINATDDAPALANAGNTASYTEAGGAATLSSAITASDVDNQTLSGATVSISSGFLTGDTLGFTSQNGIAGSYNASTGVLTLTGSASLANYQTALESITFASSSQNPTSYGADTSRTISWTVNDGSLNSTAVTSSVSVTTVDSAPSLSGAGNTASYTEAGAAATLSSAITVSDVDNQTLSGATVSISSGFLAGDTLSFTSQNGIAGSYNASTGVLTLTGSASLANYQTALESITISSSSQNPTNYGADTSRTISWTVNDGSLNSTAVTSSVSITAVNNAPSLSGAGVSAAYAVGGGAVTLDQAITVSDADNQTLSGATISISGGFANGDVLAAATGGTSISASYNAATGIMTLTGSDTPAHYQQVLDSLTFQTTSASTATRTVSWQVTDGTLPSSAVTSTVAVTAVNDAPAITLPASLSVSDTQAHALPTAIQISDTDARGGTETVTITAARGGILRIDASGAGLTVSGNGSSAITLSGSLSALNGALTGLTYQALSTAQGSDTLTVSVNDQGNSGGPAQTAGGSIAVTVVAPTITPPTPVETIMSTVATTTTATQAVQTSAQLVTVAHDTFSAGLETVVTTSSVGARPSGMQTVVSSGTGATIQSTPPVTLTPLVATSSPASGGLSVMVISDPQHLGLSEVVVARPIGQVTATGGRVDFTVPTDAFAVTQASMSVTLTATQADGRPLPSWLSFNPATGKFEGTAPPGARSVEIRVTARDGQGHQAVQVFRLNVTANNADAGETGKAVKQAAATGRAGLSEQLRSMGRDGRVAKILALIGGRAA